MLKLPRKLKLRTLGDAVLRQVCEPVAQISDEHLELAEMMIDAMDALRGVGLAANQVGFPIRMIALDAPEPDEKELAEHPLTPGEELLLPEMPTVLFNPEIVSVSETLYAHEEGCLSVPKVFGRVIRPERIVVKALFPDGEPFCAEVGGFTARILQHEIDHLDGKVYIDRMTPEDYQAVETKLERLKALKEAELLKRRLKKG